MVEGLSVLFASCRQGSGSAVVCFVQAFFGRKVVVCTHVRLGVREVTQAIRGPGVGEVAYSLLGLLSAQGGAQRSSSKLVCLSRSSRVTSAGRRGLTRFSLITTITVSNR